MKILSNNKEFFLNRKQQLVEANIQLKKEFIGIDSIIDELINLVEPWYVFPKNSIRPTVINLWGMTGVGKTSLVNRLFKLLEHDYVYKFDVGDYVDNGDSKLKYEFSQSVKKIKDGASPVLMFDEFQLGRTVNEVGEEIVKSGLRLIWELLDSGKFQILNESYYTLRIYMYYLKLNEYLSENTCTIKDGEVITGVKDFVKRFGDNSDTEESLSDPDKVNKLLEEEEERGEDKDNKDKVWAVGQDLLWGIRSVWEERFIDEIDVRHHLSKLNGKETLDFLNEAVNFSNKPIEKDFSDSLIFVIGNLDQVYGITSEINPDIDADFFHEHTNKIRLSEVKNELLGRYRPEQLSRLGNNHLIYPSLDCKSYKTIIELELEKFKDNIKERFELDIEFHSNVIDIIYNEGVFPTQGVRPVLSTIDNLVKSYFGRVISDIYINEKDVTKIYWNFDGTDYYISFSNEDNLLYENKYPVVLKTHSLRKSLDNDEQALVAAHESGHIIASIYSTGICPKSAFSRTANDAGGFTWIETPDWHTKQLFKERIITGLGGYVTEIELFGKDNLTPGSISDIENLTSIAQSMLLDFGMLTDGVPTLLGDSDKATYHNARVKDLHLLDVKVGELLDECYDECKSILERERVLLLELSNYLCKNSKIDEPTIKEFVEKYGVEKISEYKTKDNYNTFKSQLYTHINKLTELNL